MTEEERCAYCKAPLDEEDPTRANLDLCDHCNKTSTPKDGSK